MALIIKYKEYTSKEGQMIQITKLSGLTYFNLPYKYLDQKYHIYYESYFESPNHKTITGCLCSGDSFILQENQVYSKELFLKRLRFIRKCGKKLMKINKRLNAEIIKKHQTKQIII